MFSIKKKKIIHMNICFYFFNKVAPYDWLCADYSTVIKHVFFLLLLENELLKKTFVDE